jgi:protein-tyrosine phosphatase
VVCTGNICRSPMAEAFLRRHFDERAVAGRVSSTGITTEGREASQSAIEVMAERGYDISAHRSSRITPERVEAADLVLGMAREHVREAVVMVPSSLTRTFTLKELVRRAGDLGARGIDEPLERWLARLHAGRDPASLIGASPDDDVADPIGRRVSFYERTADELAELTDALVELMCGTAPDIDSTRLAAT